MSLILDALRKSEAERRRGQVPDLHAELPPRVPAPAAKSLGRVWMLAALAFLLIAAAFAARWWQPDPVAAPAPAKPAQAPPPRPVAPVVASEPVAPSMVQPSPTPMATAAPHPGSRVEPSSAPVAQVEPSPASAPPPQPASRPAPVAVAPPQAEAPVKMPIAPAMPADSGPTAGAAAPGATLRLADLSPAEREQLPALKISMHMWGPTPGQRFAIIDGARVGQGDRVGEAVVEEIVADGVVLSWHGRRLALPLR